MNNTESTSPAAVYKPYLYIAGTILLYFIIKIFFFRTSVYLQFELNYAKFTTNTLNLISNGFVVNSEMRAILYNLNVANFQNMLALKYHLISVLILFIAPKDLKKTILLFLLSSIAFFVLTVLRLVLQSYFEANLISVFIEFIISLRYLIIYLLIVFQFKSHQQTRKLMEIWRTLIQNPFIFSFNSLMLILVATRAVSGLFDWFLVAKWNLLVSSLTQLLLGMSNGVMWLFGHPEAYVWDKYLILKNYWIFLDSNCLGVGLMVVFSFLVLSIKSPVTNKFIFLTLGISTILIMNAIRLSAILLYIFRNQLPASLIKDYHDLSNNIFYIVVFFIILIYIFWFQNIQFNPQKANRQITN